MEYNTAMRRLKAFKFRLKVSVGQARRLARFAGSCRFVYNKALAVQIHRHERNEKKQSFVDMANELPKWKIHSEMLWLQETPSQILQQALKDLDRAFVNFFQKRAQFPKFKKKSQQNSFRYPQGFQVDEDNSRLFLPKLGWVKYHNSRKIEGTPKNMTISGKNGKWYASVQTESEVEAPVHPGKTMVGVDLGVARLATLSNGVVIEPVHSLGRRLTRLARLQRALARKKKFSSNWKKQKRKISRFHEKVANLRKDVLHQATTAISQNHAVVVLEDLKVQKMSHSRAGSLKKPGKKVKAKAGLNRSILDQGWYEFRRQLEYKQEWRGGWVLVVDPSNTSRTCGACGHVEKANRLTQERFKCVSCGYEENADLNAARNILAAGQAVMACGEKADSGLSRKQEPAEAIRLKSA